MAPPDTDPPSLADEVQALWAGLVTVRCLSIVADLGVADRLVGKPQTVAELAAAAGADADALNRVLRLLATRGIFAVDDAGRFSLTPAAEALRSDVAGSLRDRLSPAWQDLVWSAYLRLPEAVRTGANAFELAYGQHLWDYLASHPEAGRAFDRAMARVSGPEDQAIAASYPFGHFQRIVDIGAGRGGLVDAILAAHSRPTAVLFDRPDVIASQGNVLVQAMERCEVVGGDFFDAVPAGGDLYLLKRIVHDWDDARATMILKKIRRAMASDGRLLVIEAVIAPGNAPDPAKVQDVAMMAVTPGRERTREEFARLLSGAGFRLDRIAPTTPPQLIQLIEAVPAA